MHSSQASDAQKLYDNRSSKYDDSWHPRFARHLLQLAHPQSGEHVLDLACGTGLVTSAAVEAVGSSGYVTGVDISAGMLAEARKKSLELGTESVEFYQHSITDLDSLDALKERKGSFDLITVASALVLLPEPEIAVKGWIEWLKPGGRLIVDVTHVQSQIVGITFEKAGKRSGIPVPFHRLNFQESNDLRHLLENAGLQNVDLKAMSQLHIEGTDNLEDYITPPDALRVDREYSIDDAGDIFEKSISSPAFESMTSPGTRDRAKKLFIEEWANLADSSGKIKEYDCVYVGLGWKP